MYLFGVCAAVHAEPVSTLDQLLEHATSFEISLNVTRGPKVADADWNQFGQTCKDLADALQAGNYGKALQLADQVYTIHKKMPDTHANLAVSLDPEPEKKGNEHDEKNINYISLGYRASKKDTAPVLWQAMLTVASACAKFVATHPDASYDEIKLHVAQALCK